MNEKTYCGIKAKSRLQELELIAFQEITGEEIELTLRAIDEKLAEEYIKLVEEEVN